jgi:hypothetical protein
VSFIPEYREDNQGQNVAGMYLRPSVSFEIGFVDGACRLEGKLMKLTPDLAVATGLGSENPLRRSHEK